jgi:CPA2 family monovalent cation:H+ antiporter-2
MPEHGGLPFLRELLLFLVIAGVLMPLLARLRVNQVLGFLVAGLVVGPHGIGALVERWPWLGWVSFPREEAVTALAELGVIFLLFRIGLELSTERLYALRRLVFGTGLAQVSVSGLLIGGVLLALGIGTELALLLGFTLALSSTAIVVQLLNQSGAFGTRLGQAAFAVLLLQDLAVVPLLVLVGVLGKSDGGSLVVAVALALGKAVLAVTLIHLIGRKLLRPAFRHLLRGADSDVFMALTLLAVLGIAALTWGAGLSMALGAFLAGVLLSGTEYRHQIGISFDPFKGLLLGLFFLAVGMEINLAAIARDPLTVASAVLGLVLIKATVVAVLFRLAGIGWGRSIEGGLLLGQGGEFAFIVVGVGLAIGLVPAEVAAFVMLVVGTSMLLTPLLARLGHSLGAAIDRRLPMPERAIDAVRDLPMAPVLIAGYGRVGRMIGEILAREEVPFVAVDLDAENIATARREGRPVHFGDASQPELLLRLHADRAPAIVLTMDDAAAALHAVHGIRAALPNVPLDARARDETHAALLCAAGATSVVPETLESSLSLAGFALGATGIPEPSVAQMLDREREERSRLAGAA